MFRAVCRKYPGFFVRRVFEFFAWNFCRQHPETSMNIGFQGSSLRNINVAPAAKMRPWAALEFFNEDAGAPVATGAGLR
jgi:hypothetical protein